MTDWHLLRNEGLRAVASPISGGRLALAIRPTIAAVYLTRHCNSRCTMCDFWKNERDPGELSSEQWGVIFSRLKAFGVGYVGVNASGEMFTRPDVFTILGHLNDLGLGFGVNSNGTLLGEKKARRLAALTPRAVTIGLDGVGDPSYQRTRGLPGGFTKVSRNLQAMLDAGIGNLRIGSVLMRENLDDWVRLAEFALEAGLAGIRFTAYHDGYFHKTPSDAVSPYADPSFLARAEQEIERLLVLKRATGIVSNSADYLRRVPEYYRNGGSYFPVPCLQGGNRIELDVYGNVTLCSFMTSPLGNLLNQEMEAIWESAIHREAREAAFAGNCPRCFLSCYGEENLRLSTIGFLPSFRESMRRARRMSGGSRSHV